MNAKDKIENRMTSTQTMLCIGLDPDISLMPQKFGKSRKPLFTFCRLVIDTTYESAAAFKINTAFFEKYGTDGIGELKQTCDYLRKKFPTIPLLLDAKRADIRSTNLGYVSFVYDYLNADGVTLHPYLGSEALKPFLDRKDKAAIILCRTSNQGSGEFQDLRVKSKGKTFPLYEIVAQTVVSKWNRNGNCLLVVGATYPSELKKVRSIVGDMTLLVPGIGAQGGEIKKVVRAGLNSKKSGLLINIGRAILYKGSAEEIGLAARQCRAEINLYV
ncbi:orotidine-5'-phosphate decarboxylase [Patescibacteria group bacterium]|nr:orotidine-5'-phosphate decarboxylase [Patescibacteria group bacterium]